MRHVDPRRDSRRSDLSRAGTLAGRCRTLDGRDPGAGLATRRFPREPCLGSLILAGCTRTPCR